MFAPVSPPVLLDSGDRLPRAEFHRRYCLRPDIKKAELIGGVVYVPSPTRYAYHNRPHGFVLEWLTAYARRHAGVRYGFEATVYLDAVDEVQPDAFLFRDPPGPGGARITIDDYIDGAPELVVEIAASSVSYDLHDKLAAYRRSGVQEYIVWRVLDGAIDWFRLNQGEYQRVDPNERGLIESQAFPGLRLHVACMLVGDTAGVLAALSEDA